MCLYVNDTVPNECQVYHVQKKRYVKTGEFAILGRIYWTRCTFGEEQVNLGVQLDGADLVDTGEGDQLQVGLQHPTSMFVYGRVSDPDFDKIWIQCS